MEMRGVSDTVGRQYRGVRCRKLDMAIAASIEPISSYVDTHSCLSRTNLSTVRMYTMSLARQHRSDSKANPASAGLPASNVSNRTSFRSPARFGDSVANSLNAVIVATLFKAP